MQGIQIAHIIQDEKFPDAAYRAFEEVLPNGNTFFIPKRKEEIRYVKKTPLNHINRYAFLDPFFLRSLQAYDLVILHSLNPFNAELVTRSKNINFLWIGMGYDYYEFIHSEFESMLKPETKRFFKESYSSLASEKSWATRLEEALNKLICWRSRNKEKVIRRINYFAPVLEEEYRLIDKLHPNMLNQFVDWKYGMTVGLFNGSISSQEVTGKNILVGNSAAVTNNQVDAFELINEPALAEGAKIICPLSYGNPTHKNFVIERGRALFGDAFMPIVDFMKFDEYMALIASCSSILMNQKRQQAAGNIVSGLYMGARVFLDKENPLLASFRRQGLIINSLDELEADSTLLTIPLSPDEKEHNKKVLRDTRGQHAVARRTKDLIAKCCKPSSNASYHTNSLPRSFDS